MNTRKKYQLNPDLEKQIVDLAKKYNLEKVILFGSRARGDNRERSDIDLAISGGDTVGFSTEVNEEGVRTLLTIETVSLDEHVSEKLQKNLDNEGISLYAKKGIILKSVGEFTT